MSVDPNSSTPIFQQIADHIRRAVAAGVYRPGEMIPSTRAMALELTVNPNTVQRAYEALEREGLIRARKGLGMFVTAAGVAAARSTSERDVHDAFVTGIRAGQAANMPGERIRETFDSAAAELLDESRSET